MEQNDHILWPQELTMYFSAFYLVYDESNNRTETERISENIKNNLFFLFSETIENR